MTLSKLKIAAVLLLTVAVLPAIGLLTHDSAAADQAGAAAVKKERRDSLNVEGIHLHFAATNSRIRILATCQEETYYCEADRAIYDEDKGLIHLDGNVSVERHKSTDVRRKPEAHRGGRIMVYPKNGTIKIEQE
jgi:lipopolysaccharide export system protein LptA